MTNEELSAEIARRLFELEPHPTLSGWFLNAAIGYKGDYSRPVYASDHNAALGLVVPEMRRRGYEFCLADEEDYVLADFVHKPVWGEVMYQGRAPFGEEPRGICEAALAALDREGKS